MKNWFQLLVLFELIVIIILQSTDQTICMGAQDGGGLGRLVVVTLHNAGAGDAQLTPLTDGQLRVGARLKDGHQRVDQRQLTEPSPWQVSLFLLLLPSMS